MYIPTNVSEIEKNDMILYNSILWIVVKAELNMLGQYDIYGTPVSVPRQVPALHLVLGPDSALMVRE